MSGQKTELVIVRIGEQRWHGMKFSLGQRGVQPVLSINDRELRIYERSRIEWDGESITVEIKYAPLRVEVLMPVRFKQSVKRRSRKSAPA